MLQTPETNVQMAALKLLRFKMLKAVEKAKGKGFDPSIHVEALNEILLVGGMEVVTPAETEVKEIDVIQVNKEEA